MVTRFAKTALIVDDNLADTYLLQKSLRQFGVSNIVSVENAEQAAKYIAGLFPFADRYLPDVIFIDLRMAGIDGFQLIQWLSGNPLFSQIHLVVYSGSNDPLDRSKAMELGAKAFYQKTGEREKLTSIVRDVLGIISAS